jgi:hypothetical protein
LAGDRPGCATDARRYDGADRAGAGLAVAVLYVLPFAVLWWFGPLAWVGLVPGAVGLRWTTHPPHRHPLGVLYLILAVVSLGALMIGLSGTDTAELS